MKKGKAKKGEGEKGKGRRKGRNITTMVVAEGKRPF